MPLHAPRRYKALLMSAAVQFLTKFLEIVKLALNDDERRLKLELTVRLAGLEQERLDNKSRFYKVAFKYCRNGYYYIGLHRHAFGKFVYKWMGSISDCHVLHEKSLQEMFEPFFEGDRMEVLNDSDEEEAATSDGDDGLSVYAVVDGEQDWGHEDIVHYIL